MDKELDYAGKYKRHELTGLRIKLLSVNPKGWRARVMDIKDPKYIVNLTTEDLNKRFVDIAEE